MKRLSQAVWFLLVPYFAIARLNVTPWNGETRQSFNRSNAQAVLALIIVWPLMFVLPTADQFGELTRNHPKVFAYVVASLVFAPAWFFVSMWLRGDRERYYASLYNSMPLWKRRVYGIATFGLAVLVLWAVPVKHSPNPQAKHLICDAAASEVTAEACSTV
jgi:hypothetical protein